MTLYYNDTFTGHYPVGTAAIVWASSRVRAAIKLETELDRIGLKQKIEFSDMKEFKPTRYESVLILNDGNY